MAGSEAGEPDWRRLNRANWDERVGVHLGPRGYDLAPLRAGHGRLTPIEEAELGPVAGLRVLHLQCHIGSDSLVLAQRGAEVVGLDFSAPAIAAARELAAELGLTGHVRFVQADVYDAPAAIAEPAGFDCVYASWGTICWLPDVARWARVVAHFLKPGGVFYFADGHPMALVFEDATADSSGRPGWYVPYLGQPHLIDTNPRDYADTEATLANATTHVWLHPVSEVVTALIAAGLRLDWLHEHDGASSRMFQLQVECPDGLFRWPDKTWLPLAYSLQATRT
ncbi:MAG TPA: methyltransferase domain-containing protein [Acetobacteraceae bacterium]|nr:methyltransferase domain-containing protein [Acetobacteraceae bacterium]